MYSVFFLFVLRNKADVSLFWEIWGPQRLPSDHKIGHKLPFGQKHHQMGFYNYSGGGLSEGIFSGLANFSTFYRMSLNRFHLLFSCEEAALEVQR